MVVVHSPCLGLSTRYNCELFNVFIVLSVRVADVPQEQTKLLYNEKCHLTNSTLRCQVRVKEVKKFGYLEGCGSCLIQLDSPLDLGAARPFEAVREAAAAAEQVQSPEGTDNFPELGLGHRQFRRRVFHGFV